MVSMLTVAPPKELERVNSLSVNEFVQDYLQPMRPVVIEGAAADWPAVKRWNDDYLREHAGDVSLTVKAKADYTDGESKREVESSKELTLSNVLESISQDNPPELS